LSVFLLTTVFTILSVLLKKCKKPYISNLRYFFFIYIFFVGVLHAFQNYYPKQTPLDFIWGCGVLIGIYSYFKPHRIIVKILTYVAYIFSPVFIIICVNVFFFRAWGTTPLPIPNLNHVSSKQSDIPVFFFIFDEWSFSRTTHNGQPIPRLKHLNVFNKTSIFFKNAYSPSFKTSLSLPRIIFQTNNDLVMDPRGLLWIQNDNMIPAESVSNIFHFFKNQGYYTGLLGFNMPYNKFVGGRLDYIKSMRQNPFGKSFLERILTVGISNARRCVDPIGRAIFPVAYRYVLSRHWFKINQEIKADFEFIVNSWPRKSFYFFHWPIPHGPFIFNPDGRFNWPWLPDPEHYENNLKYLDNLIGELVHYLKRHKKYENALIIITSDHSWKSDPDAVYHSNTPKRKFIENHEELRHVPLMIKLPGQTENVIVDNKFELIELYGLIEQVIAKRLETKDIMETFK